MATITRYRLLDRQDEYVDGAEYDSLEQAKRQAAPRGYAVEAVEYEYSDAELVWTPDGSDTWPPEKAEPVRYAPDAAVDWPKP